MEVGMALSRMLRPLALAALAALACAKPAAAEEDLDMCIPDVASAPARVVPAALRLAQAAVEVKITYVGHSTFLIESPGGIKIATDYNDYVRPRERLDVITMNKAHNTHFSYAPDPAIPHVLRGWEPRGGSAKHDLKVGDVRVRNISTNIRDWGGGTEYGGNSIFVFEVAGLCIAHLGHLHHLLNPEHFKQLGRIDVLLVPVDGGYTLDLEGMLDVIKRIRAPIMIPMHYFSQSTLDRFLSRMGSAFAVERREAPVLVVSRETLPAPPRVVVLPGR
jgi:L-ascorbate metabolism protein UlaG (beta-lactamase superfamily)